MSGGKKHAHKAKQILSYSLVGTVLCSFPFYIFATQYHIYCILFYISIVLIFLGESSLIIQSDYLFMPHLIIITYTCSCTPPHHHYLHLFMHPTSSSLTSFPVTKYAMEPKSTIVERFWDCSCTFSGCPGLKGLPGTLWVVLG